jgi:hypothetical protein
MINSKIIQLPEVKVIPLSFESTNDRDKIFFGNRVCDNCGKNKDVMGGKSCSKGHFLCHSCASRHIHCPLCRHTLR